MSGVRIGAGTSALLHKQTREQPIPLIGGEGAWLHGADGARYLDTCGGVGVSSLGHRHPRIVEAVRRHAGDLAWAHAGTFVTSSAQDLAELLCADSGGLTHAQFLSGGSEAMELALKLAYQYHHECGHSERTVFVGRRQSYHGSTFGTLAVSGNRQRRSIFEPMLGPAVFVSPCYEYRDRTPGETDAGYVARLAAELEDTVETVGSHRVAAFVAETVVGSTAGAVPPVAGYLAAVADVCRRHGVLLVLDEVMAGMGRTGCRFAYLEDGVLPDIVAVGKGLAAGYQPISGVLLAPAIRDAIDEGSGSVRNGQTHVNHPLAAAVALEVQRTIDDEELLASVVRNGDLLRRNLIERLAHAPYLGDVRGRGMFLGLEFVADRGSKRPFAAGSELAAGLKREGLQEGLLLYPGHGTIDGERGHHLLLAPPFVTSPAELDELADRLTRVLDRCLLPATAAAPAVDREGVPT